MESPINIAIVASIGVISTGFLALIWRTFVIIKKRLDAIPEIISALAIVSKTMSSQTVASRYTIKAIRSHSYALKEIGCNGSVTTALEHLGKAEDAINGRANENAEAAMAVPSIAV